jgi:hypothetical protein
MWLALSELADWDAVTQGFYTHVTVWPVSSRLRPLGAPWSNRTSTGGNFGAQTLSHKL